MTYPPIGGNVCITRAWSMPNKETFKIPPIALLISRYMTNARLNGHITADPFARNSTIADYTNDIDSSTLAKDHLDAVEWIRSKCPHNVGLMLIDPPYSARQMAEHYPRSNDKLKFSNAMLMGQVRKAVHVVMRKGGTVITCGWNSNGMGKPFELTEVLLVAHGSSHNDTIVTVEVLP